MAIILNSHGSVDFLIFDNFSFHAKKSLKRTSCPSITLNLNFPGEAMNYFFEIILKKNTQWNYFLVKYNLRPVLMYGKILDDLKINEIELIFGLTEHYTDIGLTNSKRMQLLGKAFNIFAFVQLLSKLKLFFQCENDIIEL